MEMVKAGRRSDELSKEYGPSADSIRNWVKGAKSVELEDGTEVTSKEFKQLQRENQRLKEELEIFKSCGGVTGKALGRINCLVFIEDQLLRHRLSIILSALKLPRSTYYHWKRYQPSQHERVDNQLKEKIELIWENNYRAYGYPRITMVLRKSGICVGSKRILRLMREMEIHSLMNRRFKKPGTHVDHSQRPNLIKHQPNARIWRADITYLELRPGTWVYLSSIYEPKVHQVLAFKIGRQMEATLVVETINQALECHQKPQYFHSDMGSQYTSNEVETLLERHQISHSYSKQGYPYDNGPIEAFHSLLKREFAFQTTFSNFEDLVIRTSNYISWFNSDRIRTSV
ncbi:IS3 family transposase [Lactiplantibacillus pentosus]|nr:IS3 family transposase [Lactiplantibacillus pentosus]